MATEEHSEEEFVTDSMVHGYTMYIRMTNRQKQILKKQREDGEWLYQAYEQQS